MFSKAMDAKYRVLKLNRNPDPNPDILPFPSTVKANPHATQLSRIQPFKFLSKKSLRIFLAFVYV